MARRSAPPECAQCGARIPPKAHACPQCGADERTGWSESSIYDGLDLPETSWEDEPQRLRRTSTHRGGMPWYWTAVALIMSILAILYVLRAL